jgi:hypothetical protein
MAKEMVTVFHPYPFEVAKRSTLEVALAEVTGR